MKIIRIGNSRGIRIPRAILEQCRLTSAVELEVRGGELVVRPLDRPRAGWEEAFKVMAEWGDDELIDQMDLLRNDWDQEEWAW